MIWYDVGINYIMQVFREPCQRALFLLEMPPCALGLTLKDLDVNRDLHGFE